MKMCNNTKKFIVVSNRLPVTLEKKDGKWELKQSPGGLASALTDLRGQFEFLWVGWPGFEIKTEDQEEVTKILNEKKCVPVFLSEKLKSLYYDGFSNSVIWPLFHYHFCKEGFNTKYWEGYKEANMEFGKVVAQIACKGDIVWVHDYQLMLLPEIVKRSSQVSVCFFLHVPFPSSDVFRTQVMKKEILMGLLSCDLVGFHTYAYARHFLNSCKYILGLKISFNYVELPERVVHIGIFPIGTDPKRFQEALSSPAVIERCAELKSKFKNYKVIVGVDRLDYIKGIPQKLLALEKLLDTHPNYIGKIVLIQVAVPSRQDVKEYRVLYELITNLVGRINGKFSKSDYCPIYFVHNSVSFSELVALYSISDICLVTSIRDGMNLVCLEYLASKANSFGTLILSEFAGAALSLDGALIINPWDISSVAESINQAILMPEDKIKHNYAKMSDYVNKHTVYKWGKDFINEILRICSVISRGSRRISNEKIRDACLKFPGKKFLFLNCDTLISPIYRINEFNENSFKNLRNALSDLARNTEFYVYVLSSEGKSELCEWFPDRNLGLAAEGGCFYRHPLKTKSENSLSPNLDKSSWISLIPSNMIEWKSKFKPFLELYSSSVPGSYIEDKEASLVWHYKNSDPAFRSWKLPQLLECVADTALNMFLSATVESSAVTLKPRHLDNTSAICAVLRDHVSILKNKPTNFVSKWGLQLGFDYREYYPKIYLNEKDFYIFATDLRFEDEAHRIMFNSTLNTEHSNNQKINENILLFSIEGQNRSSQYHFNTFSEFVSMLNYISSAQMT